MAEGGQQPNSGPERPGPLPRQPQWHGWKTVAGLGYAAVLFAAVLSHNRYALGAAVVLIGVLGGAWALTRNDEQLHDGLRDTRGPGWMLGLGMSKIPGAGARIAYTLMCLAIVALGVLELAR